MFRLKVSDKFGHVLSKLQAMVTSNHKFCKEILLPKYIILEDLDKNEGLELKAKIDSIYKEKELTVAVKFQFQDTTITLLGVSRRSWANPTLEFDDAMNYGLEYKGFKLPIANITNPSARNNISLDKVSEIVHINVINLQKKVESDAPDEKFLWCNWIQKLPAPYDGRHSEAKLPQWMSDRSVKKTCESIVDARKMIKLAKEHGKKYELEDMPPLELADDLQDKSDKTKEKMKNINIFYVKNVMKITEADEKDEVDKEKDVKDEELKRRRAEQQRQEEQKRRNYEEYQQKRYQEEHEKQRRNDEQFQDRINHSIENHNNLKNEDHETKVNRYRNHLADHERRVRQYEANQIGMLEEEHKRRKEYEEHMKAKKNSEYLEKKQHILDSSPPHIKNDILLMPYQSSPSTRSAPILNTHFPPPPPPALFSSYPWSNHSHNMGWENRKVTVNWDDCQDLLQQSEQLRARAEFVKEQKEREKYERKREKEELERQKEKEENENQIARYKQYLEKAKRHQEKEEYEKVKNKEEKKLLEEAKKQQEIQDFERFRSNITSVVNRKTPEPQYEEIKDDTAPDPHNQKITVRMPGDFEPLVERPSKPSRRPLFDRAPGAQRQEVPDISLPPPTGFGTVNQHVRPIRPLSSHSGSQDWSGLTYLGPRFPSLEKEMVHEDDILPRIVYKKKMEMLRQLTEDRLREITTLEGSIHETVYNTQENQPPCSLLANQDIVTASMCPQLLPGSTKEKILSMKEILELIEEKRQEHIETLEWLQKQPHHKIRELVNANDNGAWDTAEDEEDDNNDDENIVTIDDDVDDEDDTQAQQRASARLATKPRVNYKKMNKQGKDDSHFDEY